MRHRHMSFPVSERRDNSRARSEHCKSPRKLGQPLAQKHGTSQQMSADPACCVILAPHAMSLIALLKMCQICVSRARIPKPPPSRASDPCQGHSRGRRFHAKIDDSPYRSSPIVTCLPVRWPMKSSGEVVKARGWLGELGSSTRCQPHHLRKSRRLAYALKTTAGFLIFLEANSSVCISPMSRCSTLCEPHSKTAARTAPNTSLWEAPTLIASMMKLLACPWDCVLLESASAEVRTRDMDVLAQAKSWKPNDQNWKTSLATTFGTCTEVLSRRERGCSRLDGCSSGRSTETGQIVTLTLATSAGWRLWRAHDQDRILTVRLDGSAEAHVRSN